MYNVYTSHSIQDGKMRPVQPHKTFSNQRVMMTKNWVPCYAFFGSAQIKSQQIRLMFC